MAVNILNAGLTTLSSFEKLWENPDGDNVKSDSYTFPAQTVSASISGHDITTLFMYLIIFKDKRCSHNMIALFPVFYFLKKAICFQDKDVLSDTVDLKTDNVFRAFTCDASTNKISFEDCKETSNGVTTVNNSRIVPTAVYAVPASFFDAIIT